MSIYNIPIHVLHEYIRQLKKDHPPGTKIVVVHADDFVNPIINGTEGTVKFVDRSGCLHVETRSGRHIVLNYKHGDRWRILHYPDDKNKSPL